MILSGEMMLRFLGWTEAADLVIASLEKTIASKRVTYDLARLIDGATELKTSEFADAMIGTCRRSDRRGRVTRRRHEALERRDGLREPSGADK